MHFRIVICCCLALFTGILGKKSRIFGGVPATITDFPHLVSIRKYITHQLVCGGSIITRWNVLTAAHCLIGQNNYYADLRIFTGSTSSRNIMGDRFRIQNAYFHPEMRGWNSRSIHMHDISVVKLQTMITFSNMQNKIPLPTRPPNTDNIVVLAGWGATDSTQGYVSSTNLKKLPAYILNYTDCNPHVPITLDNDKFCTFNSVGKNVCVGDGGGSVTSNGELYGVILYSFDCNREIPNVHTSVYHYLDFIRSHMIE